MLDVKLSKNKITVFFMILILTLSISVCDNPGTDNNCYIREIGDSGKYLMHLEGDPYTMGYAMGNMRPDDVIRMCSPEFYIGVVSGLISEATDEPSSALVALRELIGDGDGPIITAIINGVKALTSLHLKSIPKEYIDEMKGIVDGVNDARPGADLKFGDVLLLNVAVDTILSIAYPLIVPSLESEFTVELPHMCDGFVATGNATSDGRTIMGRSFMFTKDVMHEVALLVEYVPENGNKFVSVSAPGFVGVTAAMNSKGIGIGMDMIPSIDSSFKNLGMGTLLLARQAIQYSNELSDAVGIITAAEKGVPWLYFLGDGGGSEIGGAVVETAAGKQAVRYSDYADLTLQIEDLDDLITVANHYIIPDMYVDTGAAAIPDSTWRYEIITNLVLDSYGYLDVEKAKDIIDYLHPPKYGYYGDDINQPVPTSRTVFDLTNLELWSLYGLYSDPWANHKL